MNSTTDFGTQEQFEKGVIETTKLRDRLTKYLETPKDANSFMLQ
jgi:hypothetical protein